MALPLLKVGIEKLQEMLETGDVVTRLEAILALMRAGPSVAKG
jgi:hypothetical protein